MLYAIGEIVLVVVGIFIGLQFDKASSLNSQQKKTENYYSRIHEELQLSIELIENNSDYSFRLIEGLENCLQKIVQKRTDSLFVKNLSFISDVEEQTFFFPVIDEFLEQGYLTSVKDARLRKDFQYLAYYRKQSDKDDRRIFQYESQLLMPYISNKLNYLDIDLTNFSSEMFKLKRTSFEDDYIADYDALIDDLETWNIIAYRLDIEKDRIVNNKNLLTVLQKLEAKLSVKD